MQHRSWLERYLGQCAARTLQRERPYIIAVTGTVGKSTTKEAIGAMLQAGLPGSGVRVSPKNYNNEIGLPLTVFGREAPGRSLVKWLEILWQSTLLASGIRRTGIRTYVLEMGADHPGDLAYLTSLAQPDLSVITAVTPEDPSLAPVHVEFYPTADAVAEEKGTLIRVLHPEGTAILNADDRRVFALRHSTRGHVYTFGETDSADIHILGAQVIVTEGQHGAIPTGLEIMIEWLHRREKIFIPGVFGKSCAYSVAAAAAVAMTLDKTPDAIQEFSNHFHSLPGRTRIIPGIKYTTLFDDTYNASPASVVSALADLATVPLLEHQRRIACLGEMRELGEQSRDLHYRIGAEAAKRGVDLFVACGTMASALAQGARDHGLTEERVHVFDDVPEAGRFLQDWIRPGDIILAKASEGRLNPKGCRMERVIKELMAEPLRASELLCRQEENWKRYGPFV